MESNCNMNSSNGRCYRNSMNQGCRQREMQRMNEQRMRMANDRGRNVRVECECACKVSASKNCHKEDPMETLGNQFPLVMAYVPWQQWGELYDADCGLMQGTIFKDLNQIFCGVRC